MARHDSGPEGSSAAARTAPSIGSELVCGYIDLHAQQARPERLSLRIGPHGERTAPSQSSVKQKVQGTDVGQLEPLHRARAETSEMILDTLGSDLAHQYRIVALLAGNQADVGRVSLVAGTCVSNFDKADPHGSILSRA